MAENHRRAACMCQCEPHQVEPVRRIVVGVGAEIVHPRSRRISEVVPRRSGGGEPEGEGVMADRVEHAHPVLAAHVSGGLGGAA